MLGLTILCVILWLMLGESVRVSLVLAAQVIDAKKGDFVKDIPKSIFWLIGPLMFVYVILVRKGESV
jgi:hypothetical protein